MRLPSLKFAAVMVTACAIAGFASTGVRADTTGFASGFVGNSQMSDDTTPGVFDSAVVSFAVFHNADGGSWVTALQNFLGAGSATLNPKLLVGGGATLDTNAQYVYMYQVVSTVATTSNLEELKAPGANIFTSAGQFVGQIFQTLSPQPPGPPPGPLAPTNVTGTQHPGAVLPSTLGLGTLTGTDDVPDGNPSASNGLVLNIVNNPGNPGTTVWDASAVDLFGAGTIGDGSGNLTWHFGGIPDPSIGGQQNKIAPDNTSSIMFATSDVAPAGFNTGFIHNTGQSNGDLPTPAPEPGSLVLAGMGIASLLGYHVRRRKLNAANAAA